MEGPAQGEGEITIRFRHGDPAGNEKAERWFFDLVERLGGERQPADGNMHGGTIFPGFHTCPVEGRLHATYTNDNGETFTVDRSADEAGGVTNPVG